MTLTRTLTFVVIGWIASAIFLPLQVFAKTPDYVLGRIVLQVEARGEAWYVSPVSRERFYLRDGGAAFSILRNFGLGISNTDLSRIPVGLEGRADYDSDGDKLPDRLEEALGTDPTDVDTDGDGFSDHTEVKNGFNPLGPGRTVIDPVLTGRLKGRVLLQVESRGEAWYVNPADGKRYYMKNGDAAYQIMRFLSLGITDADLASIPVATDSPLPTSEPTPALAPASTPAPQPRPRVESIPFVDYSSDYLVLAPDELYDSALRLKAYRESRGHRVSVMPLSAISAVQVDADTIDTWLENYYRANPSLEYIALLGDITLFPAKEVYLPRTDDFAFSDLHLAVISEENSADFSRDFKVGRIPVRTNDEFSDYLAKIRSFEALGGRGKRIIFFGQEAEMYYALQRDVSRAESFGFETTALIKPTADMLEAELRKGDVAMMIYYGHGSSRCVFGFCIKDIDIITNPIIFLSGGCGFADSKMYRSLAEELVVDDVGSIASIGSTKNGGYGYMYTFVPGFLEAAATEGTLGEAFNAGLDAHVSASIIGNQGVDFGSFSYYFMQRMGLIGDPALRIAW